MDTLKKKAQEILLEAGIEINGKKDFDIQVHDDRFYSRVLSGGSLALGESYVDGWWDVKRLDKFICKLFEANVARKIKPISLLPFYIKSKIFNRQSKSRAGQVGKEHYDKGNDLYEAMLDKRMVYTCGYWKKAKNLNEAQEAKLNLVCRKLNLKPGQKILDIGCGWGSFAKYAAEKYRVKVVGITISKEQAKLARKLCKNLPVEIRLQDYRDLNEEFDHIVSIGMFEHVGVKNYREYMKVADRCLKDNGLFLLHTIGNNKSTNRTDPWIDKYIFPGGMLPSIKQIGESIEGLFVMEDWHNFGSDYDKTLTVWYDNFKKSWKDLDRKKYDEKFKRMWEYYLLACAGSFRARKSQLWQIVLSKNGVKWGYNGVR
jgi:cyclopropane-fatty-acyl-phospholipid synthase